MSAPGMTSPIRTAGFQNLQLNAGIFLINLDYSNIADSASLKSAIASAITTGTDILGITRGGGTFTVNREIRQVEADGVRYAYKGQDIVDSAEAYLTGTLLEINATNFKRLLGTGDVATNGHKTTVTMHTAVNPDTDYIQHLCWVGDIAGGGLVLIELDNAFNTADFSLTFSDKNEGTLPFEFHARQDSVADYDNAPFRVVFFDADGSLATITINSAAGTNVGGTKITTTNSLAAGQKYVYKVGETAPVIGYYEHPDFSWTEWDGSSDIAVGAENNGKKITVAVITSGNEAIKSGSATLVVKTT